MAEKFLINALLCGVPFRYKRNGLLPMLKRNTSVKLAPQRWQDNAGDGLFDVIFSFEERVFDLIVDGNQLITINNMGKFFRSIKCITVTVVVSIY